MIGLRESLAFDETHSSCFKCPVVSRAVDPQECKNLAGRRWLKPSEKQKEANPNSTWEQRLVNFYRAVNAMHKGPAGEEPN